jgi:hypothetical protein
MIANQKTAKFFIETLIEKKVINLVPLPTEKVAHLRDLQVMRYDYSCTIELEDGTQKTIIVELQKNKNELDIGRFRQYLGKHYSEEQIEVLERNGQTIEKISYLPIVAIYFTGFNLKHEQAFIKAETKLIDLKTGQIIDEEKDKMIELLAHDSYYVQIKKISETGEDKLSKAFQMFNQGYKTEKLPEDLNHRDYKDAILDIPESQITLDTKEIFEDLHGMLKEPEVMEGYKESRRLEMLIVENGANAFEEGKIEGERQKSLEIAKNMKLAGLTIQQIASMTGLTLEEISTL